VVIVRATQIAVGDDGVIGGGLWQRLSIEFVLQDGLDGFIAERTDAQRPLTGGFQSGLAIGLADPGGTPMAGHPPVAVEDLHRTLGDACFHFTLHQLIGHRVIAPFDLDVIIDADARFLPSANTNGVAGNGESAGRSSSS
jgi:hypothetical protein